MNQTRTKLIAVRRTLKQPWNLQHDSEAMCQSVLKVPKPGKGIGYREWRVTE